MLANSVCSTRLHVEGGVRPIMPSMALVIGASVSKPHRLYSTCPLSVYICPYALAPVYTVISYGTGSDQVYDMTYSILMEEPGVSYLQSFLYTYNFCTVPTLSRSIFCTQCPFVCLLHFYIAASSL